MRGRDEDKRLKTSDADTKSPFAEPVVLPIEDSIDLHPFASKDIPSVVEEYLEQCSQAGTQGSSNHSRPWHRRSAKDRAFNSCKSIRRFFPFVTRRRKQAVGALPLFC